MRIRNVKPEFYRSDDIDALTWEQRFLFIALFTYVDDNGVGRDRESDICADLFAGDFSVDPGETVGRVRQGLAALVQQGLVVRYKADGKAFLFITGWDDHQYVKNPNRERYPRPDKELLQVSVDPGETVGRASVDVPPNLPPVVGSRSLVVGSKSLVETPSSPAGAADGIVDEFDQFWQAYPRKVGKAPALKAYRAARKKVDMSVIGAAFQTSHQAWQVGRRPLDRIPHPATWLNSEPWHDDPAAIAPVGKGRDQQDTDDLFDRAMIRAREADERESA